MKLTGMRVLTVLSVGGLILSFVLSLILKDASPFVVVGGAAVAGKAFENSMERLRSPKPPLEK